ncbi:DNA-binding protein [Tenacibaculum sp. 190524A02b]|uniref:Abi family protein n=1 Tax=Tenacibaculum vairaonense TaxID=3137860 RepID=UPI0032B1EE42
MGRIATNFDDQIKKLRSRGMIFDCSEDKVKECLSDIGYYRLGFYWNPFEKDNNHNFIENTKFSDVINLYYLDVDLRNILTKYINRIEINFRTKIVYYVSNKFKQSPTWFIDPSIMENSFLEKIDKYYGSDFKRNNKAIKKHHEKYINDRYAPAWKTLEFFTFGTILNIYRDIKDDDIRERISKLFGINNVDKFGKLMASVVLIRNLCAHGDVMFDFGLPRALPVMSNIVDKNDKTSLNACIKVITFFLEKISTNRKKDLDDEIKKLFYNYKENETIKKIITDKMKYSLE